MKKFLQDKKIYFINLIIILSTFLLILILNKVSPFGNMILGKSDDIVIFKPMLFDFITKIKNGTLLNYTFNSGLGSPIIFNFIECLSSPLNYIALFFNNIDYMYLSTIILKIAVATITMTYYVKSKTDNKYIIFIATISYVFSSWFLTYYYYMPWLDIFAFFPLFQKGLEDLINKKKYNLYIISLALITISNFYLAFSVYIYTIIYFIISLFYNQDTKKDKILKSNIITISTIVSFILIFLFVYIVFDIFIKTNIKFSGTTNNNFTIPFTNFIKSLFYGNNNLITPMNGKTFPNIACNTFIFLNVIYFFINKNITKKDKIFATIGILISLGAFFIKPFDFTLNFFHHIRGLSYRYTFIIEFLIIKMFITNIINTKSEETKKLLYTIPIIILLFIISLKNMAFNIKIFTICSIIAYIIALTLYSNNKLHKLLICILVFLQTFIAGYLLIPYNHQVETLNNSSYQKENITYRLNHNYYNEDALQIDDYSNKNLYYNLKLTNLNTPIMYNQVYYLLANLGSVHYENTAYEIEDNNELLSLLVNVKNDKNDYYLEKIYTVNSNTKLIDSGIDTTIKENFEKIISSMTGIENLFDKIILTATEDDKFYNFETDYNFYLIEISNEDGSISTIAQNYQKFNIEKKYGNKEAIIYVLNQDKLKEIYEYLSKNQIKYTYYNDNHIEGDINILSNELIFTSIPYDESWEIKVDDQIVKPTMILDSLIGIETTQGKHHISMKYKNTNYIGPTIVSLIAIISYIIFHAKRKN